MYHLVSFADSRMRRSLVRLSEQASAFNFFNIINLFDENDLPVDFKHAFKEKLVFGSRGFGYWSWKPVILSQILADMNEGDSLLYVDAGCHLNIKGKKRLIEYFELLNRTKNGIIAFQADPPNISNSSLDYDGRQLFDQPNSQWIKGDLFDYFNFRNKINVENAQAIGAGIILLRKCSASMQIVEEWRNIVCSRFDLIDDTPSLSPNLPGFIEHRHDQAIWSLLCIKHDVKTLSAYEYWYPKNNQSGQLEPDWESLSNFPIHAKRDKDLGAIKNIALFFNQHLQKIKWRMESLLK